MAETERLDYVVADKVAPTIRVKLEQIAAASDKASLAEARLAASAVKMASSASVAVERLAQAQNRTAGSAASAAAAHIRLLQTQERASTKAVSAVERETASVIKLSQAHLRAEAAFKKSAAAHTTKDTGFLGQAGQSAATGGGVGSAITGRIGQAAASNPYVAAGAIGLSAVAGAAAVHINYADQYAGLQNTLKNVTGSVETVSLSLVELNQIANKTAQPIEGVAEAYARFSRVLQPLGKSQSEVLGFTDSLSSMLFAYGKSGAEAASVTLQLTQAMGKGKLDGDEFRSVMENLPELGTAIAKELGVTRGELIKLAPQGKITADVIYNAMGRAKEQIDQLPPPVMRLDAALTKVSNGMTLWFGQLEESTGFTSIFVKAIGSIGDALDGLAKRQMQTNLLDKNLVDPAGIKRFLQLSDEQAADPKIAAKIREVADAYADANQRREAGLESTDRAAEDAFKSLQKLQGQADEYKASQVEIEAKAMAAQKRQSEASDIADNAIRQAERQLELAKMTEEQRFIALEFDKTSNDLKEKGADLSAIEIDQQEHYKKVLAETFALQKKGSGAKGVDRAAELAKITGHLDNQILRMSALGAERDKQAQFDRIEETLAGKKIQLSELEAEAIQRRIAVIQEGVKVQSAADRLYQESTGALDQYNTTVEANNQLLAMGAINLAEHTNNERLAREARDQALEPLHATNKALKEQGELLKFNARDRQIEARLLEARNAAEAKGFNFTPAHESAYRKRFEGERSQQEQRGAEDAMVGSLIAKQAQLNLETQTYLQSREKLKALGSDATTRLKVANDNGLDLGGTATDFDAMAEQREAALARVEELRYRDVINEQEASTARLRIWQYEQNAKLQYAETFFGSFTGLMASKNKEMFAIGQAAAIANATINTYQAATAAYASLAGIPFVGPALGAAAAAGAIASGLANVANIAAQQPAGFKEGGYTGNIPANDVAGVVHGREYVMDAATTSRLGRHNLDALRSGDAQLSTGSGQGQGNGNGGAQPIVNVAIFGNPQDAKTWLQSREGARVLVDVIGQNAVSVKNRLKAAG